MGYVTLSLSSPVPITADQIDVDMPKGLHPWDAVIDATTNRLRPIVLTAVLPLSV
jgi:hypothetical protein